MREPAIGYFASSEVPFGEARPIRGILIPWVSLDFLHEGSERLLVTVSQVSSPFTRRGRKIVPSSVPLGYLHWLYRGTARSILQGLNGSLQVLHYLGLLQWMRRQLE